MADRIIPLNPGPNATLGPEYSIDVKRPRNKKALNTDPQFKKVRTDILNYLVELGDASKLSQTHTYELPDLQPIMPNSRSFPMRRVS